MSTLSVVMIVKNEEDCLGRCLESVREIATEIILGDTGSTDSTRVVGLGFEASVHDIPWEEDFSAARNRVLALATGDWVLHLDADEVLDPAGAARIAALLADDSYAADAVEVSLANYCDDPRAWRWIPVGEDTAHAEGHSGYIEVQLLRLFRNGLGYEYREAVHENITESVLEKGGRVLREEIMIHHYAYGKQSDGGGEKVRWYLSLARKKLATRPDDAKSLHDFAEQALACGLVEEAEEACRKVLLSDPLHLASATTLANILLNRGDHGDAREILLRLEDGGIAPPHVLTALGAITCRSGELEVSREYLQGALRVAPKSPMARLYLARLYDREGESRLAQGELDLVWDMMPHIEEFEGRRRAHRLRLEAEEMVLNSLYAQALDTLVEALRFDAEDPFIHNDLGVVLHAMGKNGKARESLERALALAPGLQEAEENLRALG